jgi:hypothetical protein
MSDAGALAEQLNRECGCIVTDVAALQRRLDAGFGTAAINGPLLETHPHLFADVPVFLAADHARQIQRVIDAIEAVTALPGFRERILGAAPAIARAAPLARGVFLGFDFHIAPDGPKLIEINTNAGGALLNLEMQRLQRSCCTAILDSHHSIPAAEDRETAIVRMFEREWQLARGTRPQGTLAIVDDAPQGQYLYPEFLLFKRLFEARGIRTLIADARELEVTRDSLMFEGRRIDLVYNRCTDFYFDDPSHSALGEAYARDLVVITPHPHAHALYSNKQNLVLLSDAAALRAIEAAPDDIEVLTRAIPRTLRVEGAEQLWWDERKQWFFKPASGFGSRGAYRGDKITRRVFADVMRGNYIAQQFAPASERRRHSAAQDHFKLDVRSYVYAGAQLLMAARLYQGQTTNFRTAGGGFAPIYTLDPTMENATRGGCSTEARCDAASAPDVAARLHARTETDR